MLKLMGEHYPFAMGVDEAGRGPLAGPVVSAAVVLDINYPIKGLNDSKKLSAKRRKILFDEIQLKAKAIGIGECSPAEIDHLNILWATMEAMKRAIDNAHHDLNQGLPTVFVDGNRAPQILNQVFTVIKGDAAIQEIAAASIVAKVTRDDMMTELDIQYPEYGFARHSGYPTKAHQEALKRYGPTPFHRHSFRFGI